MENISGTQSADGTPRRSDAGAPRRRIAGAAPAGAEYWRVERVAHYLDVSKKRVYQLVQEKRLESINLGARQMRISRHSLDGYIADLMVKAAGAEA